MIIIDNIFINIKIRILIVSDWMIAKIVKIVKIAKVAKTIGSIIIQDMVKNKIIIYITNKISSKIFYSSSNRGSIIKIKAIITTLNLKARVRVN